MFDVINEKKFKKTNILMMIFTMEQRILDTNRGKQLSHAATDV
jgi:hypothetical protein